MKSTMRLMALLMILAIATETANAQVIKVISDKVGIGTSTPAHKLHVNGDLYGNWFRTNGARGMFSQTYGTYFYPVNTYYWIMRSDRGLSVRDKAGTIRGYLYHDAADSYGLLDRDGNWTIRTARDNYARISLNNFIRFTVLNNGQVEVNTNRDANGAAGSGSLEIGNALRLDGNEVITNTGTALYLQHDNNGDLWVDNGSFHVDASANTIGFIKAYDRNNSAYYVDPSSISRMNWVLPQADNSGYCGSSASTWGYGYFNRLYRTYEYTLSDARAKENVRPISNALDKIMQLDGKLYDLKAGVSTTYNSFPREETLIATAVASAETAGSTEIVSATNKKQTLKAVAIPTASDRIANESGSLEEAIAPEVIDGVFPENTTVQPEELMARDNTVEPISAQDKNEFETADQSQERMRRDNFGFIAQEVNEILPEVVDYDAANDIYSMSYTSIIPLLVESIKEQQHMIESQQKEIDRLIELIESK